MSFISAICGSANFWMPSFIKMRSSFSMSTFSSISLTMLGDGIQSILRVKNFGDFCTASFVAGGLV